MMVLHNRLKLSGFERDMALFVIDHRNDADMKGNKEWQLCPRYRFYSLTVKSYRNYNFHYCISCRWHERNHENVPMPVYRCKNEE